MRRNIKVLVARLKEITRESEALEAEQIQILRTIERGQLWKAHPDYKAYDWSHFVREVCPRLTVMKYNRGKTMLAKFGKKVVGRYGIDRIAVVGHYRSHRRIVAALNSYVDKTKRLPSMKTVDTIAASIENPSRPQALMTKAPISAEEWRRRYFEAKENVRKLNVENISLRKQNADLKQQNKQLQTRLERTAISTLGKLVTKKTGGSLARG